MSALLFADTGWYCRRPRSAVQMLLHLKQQQVKGPLLRHMLWGSRSLICRTQSVSCRPVTTHVQASIGKAS